jgi:small subunit ribosomal protein S6
MAAAAAQKRAREYETIYVLRPDVDPDGADRVATRVAEVVERESGRLVKVESWGRRKLAYTVAKQRRGVYYYLKYLGQGGLVSELERNLRMLDTVLKFQTVLLREDIEPESVVIDPEEIKFVPLEPPTEEDKEESREKALGLIDAPEYERARPSDDFGEDLGDEEPAEDWVGDKKPAVAREEGAADKKEEKPS